MTRSTGNNGGRRSSGQSTPAVRPMESPLTREEMITRGEKLARILQEPYVKLACNSLVDDLQDEILATEPKEVNRREDLYRQIRALSLLLSKFHEYVAVAQQLSEEVLAQARAEQREEALNEGFGPWQGPA